MNAGEMAAWAGGILGGIGGLAGGIIGTYCSIKHTSGPRERAFMAKATVATWIAVIVFVAVLFALPGPHRWLLWLPYAILLPVVILYLNRRRLSIRERESLDQASRGSGDIRASYGTLTTRTETDENPPGAKA